MRPTPALGAARPVSLWALKAALAAIAIMAIGLLLMAMPGLVFLAAADALGLVEELHSDSIWPLGILITGVGAALIVPVSLAWRFKRPDIVGWGHVWRTAVMTIAGTFLATLLVA